MAFLRKKDNLPDLPSPPDKFSDDSNEDFDDLPRYTPAVNMDEDFMKKPRVSPMPIPEFPREEQGEMHSHTVERKPLFIKIDKYETAMGIMHSINEKLDEAGSIVSELRQIRRDEDTQLDEWSEHIRAIKEKLMNVDSMLFE